MMLDLRALREFPACVTVKEDASRIAMNVPGLTLDGSVRVELKIIRTGDTYIGTGQAVCSARQECSRCLEPYAITLRGQIEFLIREMTPGETVRRDDVADTEIVVPAGTSPVDITDPLREALLLEVPLKPLCAEDCRGLCPHCGINRNEQQCTCTVETTDPRWDGLRDLKK